MVVSYIQPVNTTYEPFSHEPEYIQANRGFVQRQPLGQVRRFLDLACGTGTVTEPLLAAAPTAHLNGIDYDPVQIDLAEDYFRRQGYAVRRGFELTDEYHDGRPELVFGVGSADELPFPDAAFDCVTIGNAIHVMPDKDKFCAEVSRVLKPGGLFGFNSAFYAGTYPKGTERHFYDWMRLATLYIDDLNQKLKAENKEPIRRIHGKSHKAFKNRWYSPEEWTDLLAKHGLLAHDVNERTVLLDERCFAAVGAYGGLAEVLLSGYPVAIASEALQSTAKASLDFYHTEALPRNWLEIWATKRLE